jgi:hypothetical protein
MKKNTIIRRDYTSTDNFLPRNNRRTSNVVDVTNPIMCLGSYWPGRSGLGITVSSEYLNLPPFEGYFCEFLYFDRVLTDKETKIVEAYLKEKWCNEPDSDVITEGLSLYLDPVRSFDGIGPRVFDLSDSRLIGTLSGTMSLLSTTYSGVFVSNPNPSSGGVSRPMPNFLFGRDRRMSFLECDGITTNVWFMPRYTDGEWYNPSNATSSTYPDDLGMRNFYLTKTTDSTFNFIVTKNGTQSNNTNLFTLYHPHILTYDTGGFINTQGQQFIPSNAIMENNKWCLMTSIISRTRSSGGFPITIYLDGKFLAEKNTYSSGQNGNFWNDLSSKDWAFPGVGGYSWFQNTVGFNIKGYYGQFTMYNRPFSATEVLEYFNRTKGRYNR